MTGEPLSLVGVAQLNDRLGTVKLCFNRDITEAELKDIIAAIKKTLAPTEASLLLPILCDECGCNVSAGPHAKTCSGRYLIVFAVPASVKP
jgi:hypothetical protein